MTQDATHGILARVKVPRPHKSTFQLCVLIASIVTSAVTCSAQSKAPTYGYRIVHAYPHDPKAFTQGLIYLNGFLYESTGLEGQSTLRKVDLRTGVVLQRYDLSSDLFGEGLTNWKNTLVQLTWKAQTGFVYDRATFHLLHTFHYSGEGWGLTQDGTNVIMSDGSSSLRFLDPADFHEVKRLVVTDDGVEVHDLNELECIHGQIYANIWQTDLIAIISLKTGHVTAWIDLSGLLPASTRGNSDAVLNGIAFDAARNRLFITGKLWPKLFEIQLARKLARRNTPSQK